jgi:hypothetical protein
VASGYIDRAFQEVSINDRKKCGDYLRHYIKDVDSVRNVEFPWLTQQEVGGEWKCVPCHSQFVDYLFSRENSLFTPAHFAVTEDMTRTLCDYWISSSHNTYVTQSVFPSPILQLFNGRSMEGRIVARGLRARAIDGVPVY